MSDAPSKFFISYNKADRSWAEWVAWQVEAVGQIAIMQDWDFQPGRDFVLEMDRATRETDHTIAVLSPDYLAADYVRPEWATAFGRDPRGELRRLIPVRVATCQPEGLLAQRIYVDLVDVNETEAR